MKKYIAYGLLPLALVGLSHAADVPPVLVQRVDDIVVQLTKKEHTGNEILERVEPIFKKCATTNKNPDARAMCQSYLDNYFPALQKKWKDVKSGGMRVTPLGKLTTEERLKRMGMTASARNANTADITSQYEHTIVDYPEYGLSFLVPQFPTSQISPGYESVTTCQ